MDIDVSVLEDTALHQEGTSMSYHTVTGYAPIFCYAGREDCLAPNELRPGSQHSEKGAVKFLKRCIGILEKAGFKPEKMLVRVHSGHDSGAFIRALEDLNSNTLSSAICAVSILRSFLPAYVQMKMRNARVTERLSFSASVLIVRR